MFFAKLLPREGNFFELFDQHAAYITQAARAFMLLIENYDDSTLRERHAAEVDAAERAADRVTAEVNRLLHKTFITPIGREQIHGLINAMDDIVDLLQDATETHVAVRRAQAHRGRAAPGRDQRQVLRARAACGVADAQAEPPRRGRRGASRPARRSTSWNPTPTG